ncbi:MAG: DNA-formamidopyrimidine glycosylase [bacterium]
MPELPEVTTTITGLNTVLPSLTITDVWSDYFVNAKSNRTDNIKNETFFKKFKKEIISEKINNTERRGKNILIHLTHGKTILIHMKMTGHLLYGTYEFKHKQWTAIEPEELKDPFNRFIHLTFSLSNGKHLAFSDTRKFAKVTLFETNKRDTVIDLVGLGPEPLDNLSLQTFISQISKKPNGKIKTVLMDQSIIAGIGNIYSDEILWQAGIHPERTPKTLSGVEFKKMFSATKEILTKSIAMGGDSMSDYRNIFGQRGTFQNSHKVYRCTKQKCLKKGCDGIVMRKIIGGRSAHFCSIHQK